MSTGIKSSLVHTTFINQDFIADWANQFYLSKKAEGKSNCTLKFYQQQLNYFLKFCDAQLITHIEEITPTLIRQFLLWHGETHNAGGQHACFRTVKVFLRWYEAENDDYKNPINKIKAPKVPEKILDPASLQDIFSMVDVCKANKFTDIRDRAILLALLDTGCRAMEFLDLDLSDIDLISGQILIRNGKGMKSRYTYLGKKSRKAVRRYLKCRDDPCRALWITDEGERLGYGGLRALVCKRARLAGIDLPSLHSFRRAFAINSLRNGMDLITLSKLLGHSNLAILKQYLQITQQDLQQSHGAASPVDRYTG